MQGEPRTMQDNPQYDDVVAEVKEFLQTRREACIAAGIPDEHIVVDPGFGFGKTAKHNLSLLRHLDRLKSLGSPLLIGLSRKSLIGTVLDLPIDQRVHASVALAVIAARNGANIVRVHDVRATREAIRMAEAVYRAA